MATFQRHAGGNVSSVGYDVRTGLRTGVALGGEVVDPGELRQADQMAEQAAFGSLFLSPEGKECAEAHFAGDRLQ
ncbi:hypothetical protein [Bradyrhizobium sp. USDA 4506]